MDIRAQKNELRAIYTEKRKNLSSEEKARLDKQLSERFMNMISYRYAKQILFYASTDSEISTNLIFQKALEDGKTCFFPKCGEHSSMSFYKVTDLSELKSDAFNIKAPDGTTQLFSPQPSDIIIVPAMAYDSKGFRLGYGKGYYDRFLLNFLGIRVGLCYSEFITDKLPRGRFDMSVDIIVTEKKVIAL